MSYRPKYDCNCPLYMTDTKKRIHCEGVANVDSIKLLFNTEEEKLKYILKNCCNYEPNNCEIYKLLKEKYPDSH